MAASPLKSWLVTLQSGLDAAPEPVYLPRFDQVAGRSHGNTATDPRCGTTYSGARVIWTGRSTINPRPPPESANRGAISSAFSGCNATGLSCFGQQWSYKNVLAVRTHRH